jgi:hypothetical protein
MSGPRQRSHLRVKDSDSDGPAKVPHIPERGRSRAAGSRGGRRGRRQMPIQGGEEEIDIAISDRSVSTL